ncbi:F0F1 ATP synthase subunit delta [Pseudoclavibacter chungangensis]|uniref:ATP synthase subunit delta n=1 Tax=Pseudoclavibacter chungangensis TaxID=587635 RepID=A0A7J5BSN0_9MICO|nr:F0F1 ATP synthase subunit delta [Pseudoclavibacter chungangensis]KAB1657317.1 F0F1 ATP synthase subunit delta [Pseudoclavibacter chungangensis]NYJ66231.1 F-type H+-transporting ATPase subunit delta [Pseudoclavibacter chungangensis]
MGSATTQALTTVKREIDRTTGGTLAAARQLFDAVDAINATPALRGELSHAGISAEQRRALVQRLFADRVAPQVATILTAAAGERWSNEREFSVGLQEIGVRAVAHFTAPNERLGQELQEFLQVVTANPELELSLGSRLGSSDAKAALVRRLFGGRLSDAAITILEHLVAHPGGRRVRRLVDWATAIVADQADRQVATVQVAKPLASEQLRKLQLGLRKRFGRPVAINQVVDPAIIGGLRVQLGDDVIDDSIQAKLSHLRRQFA